MFGETRVCGETRRRLPKKDDRSTIYDLLTLPLLYSPCTRSVMCGSQDIQHLANYKPVPTPRDDAASLPFLFNPNWFEENLLKLNLNITSWLIYDDARAHDNGGFKFLQIIEFLYTQQRTFLFFTFIKMAYKFFNSRCCNRGCNKIIIILRKIAKEWRGRKKNTMERLKMKIASKDFSLRESNNEVFWSEFIRAAIRHANRRSNWVNVEFFASQRTRAQELLARSRDRFDV